MAGVAVRIPPAAKDGGTVRAVPGSGTTTFSLPVVFEHLDPATKRLIDREGSRPLVAFRDLIHGFEYFGVYPGFDLHGFLGRCFRTSHTGFLV